MVLSLGRVRLASHCAWLALALCFAAASGGCSTTADDDTPAIRGEQVLPPPAPLGTASLDQALSARRSIRTYDGKVPSTEELSRMLWAAQGITDGGGHRTAPSAGALYPLELYVLSAQGVFHYVPAGHKLQQLDLPDIREDVAEAALGQDVVRQAPMLVVVTGVISRTRAKYGDRAERYVALEVGHASQNLLLEATSLGLGARTVGAFEDEALRSALRLPSGTFPYYILCIGRPAP
ncbi:MAG: SagB/ThcOx family dehydrogenase [Deltaproteobacteria bacterium]|nr:SagB/ThcOx family dehydrogenase [Deltaproteobacteria bacterium]